MRYRVIVTPIADAEAMAAFGWYAERSKNAAARWRVGLGRALRGLADHPQRFPLSEDDSDALNREIRILLHGRGRGVFRILYTIDGEIVRVLRIRHGAQDSIEVEEGP